MDKKGTIVCPAHNTLKLPNISFIMQDIGTRHAWYELTKVKCQSQTFKVNEQNGGLIGNHETKIERTSDEIHLYFQ